MAMRTTWLFAILLGSCISLVISQNIDCSEFIYGHTGNWSCCNEEPYQLGYISSLNDPDCQEAKDDSLSYVDSHWSHFDCIAKKAMGTKELTAKGFAQMMSKNFTASIRDEIIKLFEESVKGKDEGDELQTVKDYFQIYFDADFEVCGKKLKEDGKINETQRETWAPSYTCGKDPIPFLPSDEAPFDHGKYNKCLSTMEEKLDLKFMSLESEPEDNATTAKIDIAHFSCFFIGDGFITMEETSTVVKELDKFCEKFFPHFLSKSAKKSWLEGIKEFLEKEGTAMDSDFVTKVWENSPLNGLIDTDETLFMNFNALRELARAVRDVKWNEICPYENMK